MTTSTEVSSTYHPTTGTRFQTAKLSRNPSAIAPDGSEVRVLLGLSRGGLAHFRLRAGQVSRGVAHHTVDEIWYVVAGSGQMWRQKEGVEAITPLNPGMCVSVPMGTRFQFRAASDDTLDIVGVTMPPWPGPEEAYEVAAPWTPNVPPATETATG